jgi:hypothetical protein
VNERGLAMGARGEKRTGTALALAAGLAFLWLAGGWHDPLRKHPDRARVYGASDPTVAGMPPAMTLIMVGLGGFRGVVADLLWLRVSHLQDEGDFVEMAQLAEWIAKLQPHTPEVWLFHSWNMTYNASVAMPEDADRWRWVWHGIRLLRDEGLLYNPGNPRIHEELAFVFLHKIGGVTDRSHGYYRQRLAENFQETLGAAGPGALVAGKDEEARRRLREDWRMDIDRMRELDRMHGPLDWTRPEAHALYWAWRSRQQQQHPQRKTVVAESLVRHALRKLRGEEVSQP